MTTTQRAAADQELVDYLLGALREDRTAQLDEAGVVDDEFAARLAVVEHDLVDAYLSGTLDSDEGKRFEAAYLTVPSRRRKVEIARALLNAAPHRTPAAYWWMSAAAAAVLALGLGWWALARTQRTMDDQVVQTPAPAQAASPRTAAPQPLIVALTLAPAAVRGASETPTFVKPEQPAILTLRLMGDASADRPLRSPHVVVRTVAGQEVWRGPGKPERAAGTSLLAQVDLPVANLGVDDYIVELHEGSVRGAEEARIRYFLRVRAK